jgi:hypothetical protein
MKRSRGRPPSSSREKIERYRADPNRVAASLAENYVRTFWHSDGKRISHKQAVEFAIEEFDEHWLAGRQGKPPRRPDPAQVRELLRRGRTSITIGKNHRFQCSGG